ncbi:Carbamoyl-phosphate synthase L chain ATP-binding protein [mine drainage metagenome]|uniref:Carbamoyl-phosphate synthase L chain ATP-binding protein n=1 Tax=mine drainage metagenome TaxID=410659 RepID=T0ZG66_9ZZZZ
MKLRIQITGTSSASFEPSLDYVTVKIPKWPFEKFSKDTILGVSMKSTGEVMGIGRTFEEALFKAIASLEERYQFGRSLNLNDEELIWYLKNPTHLRLRAIFEAFMRGLNSSEIKLHTAWDIDILMRIESVISALKDLRNDQRKPQISEKYWSSGFYYI